MAEAHRWHDMINGNNMRLASEFYNDGITISDEFKSAITQHVIRHKPKLIIETGTYIGTGTTDGVISGIKASGHDAVLYSIEANKKNIQMAMTLHARYVYSGTVIFMNGISLPLSWIPDEIDNDFPDEIYTDHTDPNMYLKELPAGGDYDMLGNVLDQTGNKADMIILDSAGHLGTAEYLYITERLRSPAYIFLDDIYHRKHYKTMQLAANDRRCSIIEKSRKKFGHAIIKYNYEK